MDIFFNNNTSLKLRVWDVVFCYLSFTHIEICKIHSFMYVKEFKIMTVLDILVIIN